MPKVIYDKILGDPLLYTNMRLQLIDQSLCYPMGVLEDAITRVGQSYVPVTRRTSASLDSLGILLPHLRDAWSPLAWQGATGTLTAAPIPANGTNMTVHSE
jgi:hypothetical protein